MKEVWKLVPGEWKYEYYVSNRGRVGRLLQSGKPKIIRGNMHESGYLRVRLTVPGRRRYCLCYVHRLVAMAFLEKPGWADVVHHLNHDASDNRLENLAWATYTDNARYFVEFKNEQAEAAAGGGDEVGGPAPLLCSLPLARERPPEAARGSSSGGRSEQEQVPRRQVLPESLLTMSWCVSQWEDSRFDSRPEHGYTAASQAGVGPG